MSSPDFNRRWKSQYLNNEGIVVPDELHFADMHRIAEVHR
jgi:hypothetical protein